MLRYVFLCLFLTEMLVRMYALGPRIYFESSFNRCKWQATMKDKNGRMNLNDQVWLCGDLCERIWDGLHLPQVSSCHNFKTFILPCSDFCVCMLIWKEVVNPHYVTFTMSDDITDGLIFVGIPHIQWGLEGKGFFIRSPWPRARIQLDQEVTRVQDQSVAHIDWWLSLF